MTYSSTQAVALTGIKKDMLHYLCKVGVVVPTSSRQRSERGHGVRRKYTFADLISIKVVKKLCESGVSPLKVKGAIRELHKMGGSLSSLPASRVVIFEKNVYKWDEKLDPFRMSDGQQAFGFILDLSLIRDELAADIERLVA
ncbi:MAG: MerR family transcriptional regulator [Burkholderiaceae bacterium]